MTTPIPTNQERSIQYSRRTLQRARRALYCSPFQLGLFAAMRTASVPLPAIAGQSGFEKGYSKRPISESLVESELMWLIEVGLLRREVDGQGITDSFRLTPLGRQLVGQWERQGGSLPSPPGLDRLYNNLNRWLRWLL